MPRRALAGALVVVAALAAADASSASQYCVNHAGCTAPADNFTDLQAALNQAGTDSAADTILVGAGTYHGPFTDNGGNPVTLIGAGTTTVLDDPGTGDFRTTLTINEPTSNFSSFRVVVPVGNRESGISFGGTLDRVVVDDAGTSPMSTGISGGGTIDHSVVTLTSGSSIGVLETSGRLRRSRISATMTGVAAYAVVENSLVRLTQAGAGHTGIRSSSTRTAFDQVTVVGPGDVDSFGLEASPQGGIGVPGSTPDGTATLDGLVIRGFGHALAAEPGSYECGTDNFQPIYCSDSSTISVSHSDFDPSRDVTDPTYGHITIGAGNLNVDPAFRNPAAGDYSLLRKSPVVDKGDPSAPLSGDATTDLAGAQRKVDGDGDGKAIVDMGTFELPTPRFGANALVKLDRGAKKIPASGPLPVVVSNLNGFLVRGTLSGETANKIPVGHHEKRRVGLGSKPFSVAGHRGVTVLLDLPKKVVKYFKHRGELTVDLLARVRDPAGDFRTIPKTISVALK